VKEAKTIAKIVALKLWAHQLQRVLTQDPERLADNILCISNPASINLFSKEKRNEKSEWLL